MSNIEIGTVLTEPCPECGGKMQLMFLFRTLTYVCENRFRTGCNQAMGAHPDGKPMGFPVNKEVRQKRKLLHCIMDKVWQAYRPEEQREMRKKVYVFMTEKLREKGSIEKDQDFHVAQLDGDGLSTAIKIVNTQLRKVF